MWCASLELSAQLSNLFTQCTRDTGIGKFEGALEGHRKTDRHRIESLRVLNHGTTGVLLFYPSFHGWDYHVNTQQQATPQPF